MAPIDSSELYGDEHVRRYLETDGEEGHDWRKGTAILLLFTRGRKSGEERIRPLIYRRSGDDYLVVASDGGAPGQPGWYHNLQADPGVEVQVMGERFKAHARTAGAEERPAMWAKMVEQWPDYDRYQRKTDREIPVVVLERAG
jgi:deazaflavin-dependent oxidoreductase (nitroreductase family)